MKRLTIYFSTIFILATSPALATSNSNTNKYVEQIKSEIEKILTDIKEQIDSQCATEPTIDKCKNKGKTIEQIEKAAKTTLKKLNELGKN